MFSIRFGGRLIEDDDIFPANFTVWQERGPMGRWRQRNALNHHMISGKQGARHRRRWNRKILKHKSNCEETDHEHAKERRHSFKRCFTGVLAACQISSHGDGRRTKGLCSLGKSGSNSQPLSA